jgi:hypothetical protein
MVRDMLRVFATDPALIAVTLIPPGWAKPVAGLAEFRPFGGRDALRQQLRRIGAGGAVVLGGIDGDYDEANALWRPHLHLIAAAELAPKFRELSDRFYSDSRDAYRPCVTQAVCDRAAQISYCFKLFWSAKIRFEDRSGNTRWK